MAQAFNRKQMNVKRKDLFKQPDTCGYLLYNRSENDTKSTRLEPHVLRSVLDIQVSFFEGRLVCLLCAH
jgi:hypothetical protein